MNSKRVFLLVLLMQVSWQSVAEEIVVAVASNFAGPMNEIVNEFEKSTEHEVGLAFGASGKFYAQIKHGAPFALFFSADRSKPAALVEEGLAVPDSRFTYAVGALALWSAKSDLAKEGPQALQSGNFDNLAIANPRLAPYGVAAREVLDTLDLWTSLEHKLVRGENIGQTFQFVSTGNAELGLVALSQVLTKRDASVWTVPRKLHSPIHQDAVLLRSARQSPAAREFLAFMQSETAASIIRTHGYRPMEQSAQ